jgi:hypothetical protein
MVARLKQLGMTGYYWLISDAASDWDDLKVFLPQARQAGLQVWAYLVPPSESPPVAGQYSEPFRLDYVLWGQEIAQLSLTETNLVGWVIDDFYANSSLFTPAYVSNMQAQAKQINPQLAFRPLLYFDDVTPEFVADYGPLIDGAVVAYLQDQVEIEEVWDLLNDAGMIGSDEMSFPAFTPSSLGDFVAASQNAAVLPAAHHRLLFRERDDYVGPTAGYHFKQVLIDQVVVWEEDVAGGSSSWQDITLDVGSFVGTSTNVTVEFRLFDKQGVANFPVSWSLWDLHAEGFALATDFTQPQAWQVSRQGAFETGFGLPATPGQRRFHIPFIAMSAAEEAEFRLRHGDPATPERIADQLAIYVQAWQNGNCDGVVTFALDKRPTSRTFAPVRTLLRSYMAGH